jgi:outer membrane cobalamin receptor
MKINQRFSTMKMSKLIKTAGLVSMLAVAATAVAGPQKVEKVVPVKGEPGYAYVWVTGSRIPQKIKISPIGTETFSSLSVWDRRQINQTGRQTVEGVLKQDPSASVILHGAGGIR